MPPGLNSVIKLYCIKNNSQVVKIHSELVTDLGSFPPQKVETIIQVNQFRNILYISWQMIN